MTDFKNRWSVDGKTPPSHIIPGETPDATFFNTYLRDNQLTLGYGARVRRTTTQSISNNTLTAISFNATDVWDSEGKFHDHSGAPEDLTMPWVGIYYVSAHVKWASDADGYRLLYIDAPAPTNDVWRSKIPGGLAAADVYQSVEGIVYCQTAPGTVKIQCRHTAGAAINLQAEGDNSPFAVIKFLGPGPAAGVL